MNAVAKTLIVTALAAEAVACAGPADAQDGSHSAISACEGAAVHELLGPHPEADTVRFIPGAKISQVSRDETVVMGAGAYLEAGGVWRSFTYRCRYNVHSGDHPDVAVRVGSVRKRPPPAADR